MRKFAFALVGMASLGLCGCGSSSQDQVNNAELNQPAVDLNEQANQAAMDAANAEAAALGNQQQQLNDQNAAAADNTVSPREADEQNVSGM
jgi:hypothetical protein